MGPAAIARPDDLRRRALAIAQRNSAAETGENPAGVVGLDGSQACGEVGDLLQPGKGGAGEEPDADATTVGLSQGGSPGAGEPRDQVVKRGWVQDLLDGKHVWVEVGDGRGEGVEL